MQEKKKGRARDRPKRGKKKGGESWLGRQQRADAGQDRLGRGRKKARLVLELGQ